MKMKKTASAVLALLVIAVMVAVNLLAGGLGAYMDIDLSNKNLYSISAESRQYLEQLETPVEIIILSDDTDARIKKYVSAYCSLSDNLSWQELSVVQHPELLSSYDTGADSVVVINKLNGRSKSLEFSDIIEYDLMRYAYYGEYKETQFDAESELTNALSYVISEKTFRACLTMGHGESDIARELAAELEKARFEISYTDLMLSGGIPQGCDAVIINAPQVDLSEDEGDMLRKFLAEGGNLIVLISSDFTGDYSVLFALCSEFGIEIGEGVVRDPGSCYQNEYLIFPLIGASHDISRYLGADAKCLLYQARPLSISAGDSAKVLLSTSAEGVATDIFGVEGEKTSIVLAAAADAGEGKLAVLPASLIGQTILANYGNMANRELFVNALMENIDDENAHVIASVPLGSTLNAVPSGAIYSIGMVVILPAALIIFGAVRCALRRRV